MRYVKVFGLVLVFFLVMMFFVQNQASFADPVTLRLDIFFLPPMESIPMPLYAIMLLCFTLGAALVLVMLMWDRMAMAGRLSSARRKASALEKKLHKMDEERTKAEQARLAAEAKLTEGLKDAEERVNAALRSAGGVRVPE